MLMILELKKPGPGFTPPVWAGQWNQQYIQTQSPEGLLKYHIHGGLSNWCSVCGFMHMLAHKRIQELPLYRHFPFSPSPTHSLLYSTHLSHCFISLPPIYLSPSSIFLSLPPLSLPNPFLYRPSYSLSLSLSLYLSPPLVAHVSLE